MSGTSGAGNVFSRFERDDSAIAADRWVDVDALFGGVRDAAQIAAAIRPGITSVTIRAYALPGESITPIIQSFIKDVVPAVERGLSRSWARQSSEAAE